MEKMTNEDIIKNLRHCAASEGCGKDCRLYKEYGCYFKLMYAAADALEIAANEIEGKNRQLECEKQMRQISERRLRELLGELCGVPDEKREIDEKDREAEEAERKLMDLERRLRDGM